MSKLFQAQDFHFLLPEGSIDRSLIFHTTPKAARDGSWPTIGVSYENLQPGETLPRFCNRQIATLSGTVTGLAVDSMREVHLSGQPAFEIMLRWAERANTPMRQRLVVCELPDQRALLLSNIATEAAFEETEPFFRDAFGSFGWGTPAEGAH